MESSSTPVKEKKGLKRLWNKIKLAFRSKSKDKKNRNQTSILGSSNAPETQTAPTTRPHNQEVLPSRSTVATEVAPITRIDKSTSIAEAPSEPTAEMSATPAMQAEPEGVAETLQVESDQQISEQPDTRPSNPISPSDAAKEELAKRYERAQAIFNKYNIDLSEAGWDVHPKPHIERVHKQTRIRVRWTCHKCNTTFGREKICVECTHPRCKTCVRYPTKKKKARDGKKAALTTVTTGSSTNRVHDGACHECQTTFKIGSEQCSNCHHTICHRCLQESLASAEQDEERTTVII